MKVFIEILQAASLLVVWFGIVYFTVYIATRAWCKARSRTEFVHNINLHNESSASPPDTIRGKK